MSIEVLHRGRFHDVSDATSRVVGPNAHEIRLPLTSGIHRRCRRAPNVEAWDGAVFVLEGVEAEPAVGSREDAEAVYVTVFILES